MKSIRTNPRAHAPEGDERTRTAVCEPGTDSVYVVAFVGKKGIGEIFAFPSKRDAVRAKKEWDDEWTSSEEAVVYKATLERVS